MVGGASLAPHRLRAPYPCDVGNSREVGVWLCVGQWVGARGPSNPCCLGPTACVTLLAILPGATEAQSDVWGAERVATQRGRPGGGEADA